MKQQRIFSVLAMICLVLVSSTMASPVKHRYARQDDVYGGDDSGTQPTTESIVETTNSSTNSSSSFTSTTLVSQVTSQAADATTSSTTLTSTSTTSTTTVVTTNSTTTTSTTSTTITTDSTSSTSSPTSPPATVPVTTKEPGRKFDGLSFIGGMILATGLGALIFLVIRYLRRNGASPYSNLR